MATQEKHEVAVKSGKAIEKAPARMVSPFEDFERFFDQLAPRSWLRSMRWPRALAPELGEMELWAPRVDVIDRDNEVVVKVEVPGVKKEDVQISLTGNLMTIKGETKREEKEERGDYYRCEISRGTFTRMLTLPADVDDAKAKAELRDGMLEITLPKLEQAKRRDIKIQ
ncbi:MAG: Hsp20/alpha crystallin family protein [Betaproteobacteria bacterium]|nr:Hsp20/alpha crystallin family protein [Betaproteobacteria bacterium]MBI2294057.1 Hsp20/alpha crystallin family protein [Betaproteobacteria bacterium]MBI3055230.1 Hsp20/alpha crystallin family protein [Betaproteobacteria bacterium]